MFRWLHGVSHTTRSYRSLWLVVSFVRYHLLWAIMLWSFVMTHYDWLLYYPLHRVILVVLKENKVPRISWAWLGNGGKTNQISKFLCIIFPRRIKRSCLTKLGKKKSTDPWFNSNPIWKNLRRKKTLGKFISILTFNQSRGLKPWQGKGETNPGWYS